MRSTKIIHIVSCHAEGEVGNVIVGGVALPPGNNIWDQSRWIHNDQTLRQFVLNEPRGGVFKHVNLLVPSINKKAAFGFIIMEPEHTPPMSGSNTICVATVLLDSGLIQMLEPETSFCLEAPAGLVHVKAYCENGKARSIEFQNVPSFADKLDAMGAIGVYRAAMYNCEQEDFLETFIEHFHVKLLKLKDLLYTQEAKKIAKTKHNFLVMYLDELKRELAF